jgi:molybdopterin-containing oxidoreductase family iron-sulfur binding subunit
VSLSSAALGEKLEALLKPASSQGYRLQTFPALGHFDGRGASRPWLQELPDPLTQAVWGSWVELNPVDARKLGVRTGDRVRVRSRHGEIQAPAYVYPGIRAGEAAMPLGQGHTASGRTATGVGVNVMALLDRQPDAQTGGQRWSGEAVEIALVERGRALAMVSGNDFQHGRRIARSRVVPGPEGERHEEHAVSIYKPHAHPEHRWGMVIDLDACNGCSACVVACYAENNIRVAGADEARRGRIMSWIRVERFFGDADRVGEPLQVDSIPMLCQQCDHAPCEAVCPVFAAYHSAEGLNGQIYNRCVGTRYCANNCPYKVRRFNWYEGHWPAPLNWQLNPDVTVRSKGVMEKCAFCIQRIVAAKHRAQRRGRKLADGDVVPACAQSCPARAIVFGDLNDAGSRVSQARNSARAYRVFEELNTRPAITYLERQRRRA